VSLQSGIKSASELRVAVPAALKQRLDLLIRECQTEISGLGEVEARNGELTVTSIHLLDQKGSTSETTLDPKAVLAFMASAGEIGVDLEKVRLWWHSHANGGLFWSPKDEACIAGFGSTNTPWLLSIEGNHAGNYIARYDVFPNEEVPVRLTCDAVLVPEVPARELRAIRAEIKRHVKEVPPATRRLAGPADSSRRPRR